MKTLHIGADPFPPYQYINGKGNLKGLDFDLVERTVMAMGYRPVFSLDMWSRIEAAFEKEKLDMLFQVQKSSEREAAYYFSSKLRDAETISISAHSELKDSRIDILMEGSQKVGVIKGYQYGNRIDTLSTERSVSYASTEEVIESVINKTVEVGVVDRGVFEFLDIEGSQNLVDLPELSFKRPLYVMFHSKGLRDEFNKFLKQ